MLLTGSLLNFILNKKLSHFDVKMLKMKEEMFLMK